MKSSILAAALSLLATGAFADEITINDFNWYGNEGFCHFQLPDQAFSFDDPKTWRYVFITNLPVVDLDNLPETPEEIAAAELKSYAPAFMMIDNGFHELGMISGTLEKGKLNIVYSTYGENPYDVVLEADAGEAGSESQAFTGTITVSRGEDSASFVFKGDCGV